MQFFSDLFPLQHSWLLIVSLSLGITSILLSARGKNTAALIGLFFTAFFLRLFMAHLDPFLHDWDERYHALAARNMMNNPLIPMLRAHPLLPFDYKNWGDCHIYLHKQPFFLWQMALSMKLFGVSEFAIRYPDVTTWSFGVVMLYRVALLMTQHVKIAFLAGLFMCFSYYNLEIISGYIGMDRNDGCFDFYVLASIWAFAEYRKNQKISWVLLIGFFAGFAILTKWLTGLLVFGGWGISILFMMRSKAVKKEIVHFFIALVVCCIVFVPWQLYIFHAFPVEARYEMTYNSRHVTEVMENFAGTAWFYYDKFPTYFGLYIWWLVIAGLLILPLVKKYRNPLSIAVVANFLLVFIFFSFIAKTKIPNYFMVVVPFGYIFMAVACYHILDRLKVSKFLLYPVSLLLTLIIFDLPLITEKHDKRNLDEWVTKAHNTEIYKRVKTEIPPGYKVVLNLNSLTDVEFMFYNNQYDAYSWCLNERSINELKNRKVKIAVFKAHDAYGLPDYILHYPGIYIINEQLIGLD